MLSATSCAQSLVSPDDVSISLTVKKYPSHGHAIRRHATTAIVLKHVPGKACINPVLCGCCRLDNQTVHLDAAEPAPMDVTADEQKADYS